MNERGELLASSVVEQLEQLVGRVRYDAHAVDVRPLQVAVYCELARALDTARRWERDEWDGGLERSLVDVFGGVR